MLRVRFGGRLQKLRRERVQAIQELTQDRTGVVGVKNVGDGWRGCIN